MAIAWGTISILLLLSFGEGMKRSLNKAQHGLGEDIVIMWGGQTSIPYQGLGKGRRIRFTDEDVELLKKRVSGIESISGEYVRWGASLTYKKNTVSERVTGVYPSFEDMRAHYAEIGGRFIDDPDMENRRRVIFLGNELKKRLFGEEEDAIGKIITVNNIPFTVIGVMVKKMQMGMYGGPDWDKSTIPSTTFKAIFGHKYLNDIVYKPKDPTKAEEVKQEIQKVLGAKYKFDPKDDKAFGISHLHGHHRRNDPIDSWGRGRKYHVCGCQGEDQGDRDKDGLGSQEISHHEPVHIGILAHCRLRRRLGNRGFGNYRRDLGCHPGAGRLDAVDWKAGDFYGDCGNHSGYTGDHRHRFWHFSIQKGGQREPSGVFEI